MFFQVASLFSAMEDNLLTKREALELGQELLITMYAEVAPIVQFYALNQGGEDPAQKFGFDESIARMIDGVLPLSVDGPLASRWARHVEACVRTQIRLLDGSEMPELEHYGFSTVSALMECYELSKLARGDGEGGIYPSAIRDTASMVSAFDADDPRAGFIMALNRVRLVGQVPTVRKDHFTLPKISEALDYLNQTVSTYDPHPQPCLLA
ncbi:MAG: hypothetical protein LBL30_01845 [Holosporales bacterium]|jgi:hypothetical protein|nr:hypothetical protein [Holosporales bacterium]